MRKEPGSGVPEAGLSYSWTQTTEYLGEQESNGDADSRRQDAEMAIFTANCKKPSRGKTGPPKRPGSIRQPATPRDQYLYCRPSEIVCVSLLAPAASPGNSCVDPVA